MKSFLAALLLLGILATSDAADDYARDIENLAPGKPAADTKASFEALKAAGMAAFPTLIAHFSDRNPAAQSFQEDTRNAPTIGVTCFHIIQNQIEGDWPKVFPPEYHALTAGNTAQWLDARRGLALAQLRRAAIEESLHRAEADLQRTPSDPSLKQLVPFLRLELDQANH